MKKIFVLLFGLLLFSTSCKEEEDTMQKESIVGTWMPVKVVNTTYVDGEILGQSQAHYYNECEQGSRYVFNEDLSGSVLVKGDLGGQNCLSLQDENLTYDYNSDTGKITLQYPTLKDEGKVSDVTDSSMNLQIEVIEGNTYISKTYTLQKVN